MFVLCGGCCVWGLFVGGVGVLGVCCLGSFLCLWVGCGKGLFLGGGCCVLVLVGVGWGVCVWVSVWLVVGVWVWFLSLGWVVLGGGWFVGVCAERDLAVFFWGVLLGVCLGARRGVVRGSWLV